MTNNFSRKIVLWLQYMQLPGFEKICQAQKAVVTESTASPGRRASQHFHTPALLSNHHTSGSSPCEYIAPSGCSKKITNDRLSPLTEKTTGTRSYLRSPGSRFEARKRRQTSSFCWNRGDFGAERCRRILTSRTSYCRLRKKKLYYSHQTANNLISSISHKYCEADTSRVGFPEKIFCAQPPE